jgi:hypothetical protein
LLEFFFRFNALIKGEIEDRGVPGPVDGRSWL